MRVTDKFVFVLVKAHVLDQITSLIKIKIRSVDRENPLRLQTALFPSRDCHVACDSSQKQIHL
ncbi:hypothetical protein AAFF_G00043260 [Aldrovandia affinis]|uniref:Uncharacterized protein n=1 Tax=Aldrovandia affinis TaxID=143900 RepID=A0AAD7S2F2_9TELE|nr:hypothetical protein AAFF_G00043260 [Aldrovandia affinis]